MTTVGKTTTVSFCTTCMGRLEHLKQTLPKNIADNRDCEGVQFVVLNYGGEAETENWIKDNFQSEIADGTLKYISYPAAQHFNMAHAKNMAHRHADGNIVCNLDADQFTGKSFAHFLIDEMGVTPKLSKKVYMRHDPIDIVRFSPQQQSALGKIALHKADFDAVRGYDESIVGWGDEDRNFCARLTAQRFLRPIPIETEYAQGILHSDEMRLENYSPEAQEASRARLSRNDNTKSTWVRIAGKGARFGRDIINAVRHAPMNVSGFGEGEVTINFSDIPTSLPSPPIKHSALSH